MARDAHIRFQGESAWPMNQGGGRTTILAGLVDVGDIGIRSIGVVWLLLGVAFVVVGSGLLAGIWSYPVTMGVAVASLAWCLVGLPDARIGLVLNVLL